MSPPTEATTFAGRAMGSPLRFTSVGLPRATGARAWQIVIEDIEMSEQALSRWRADSELSRLNATVGMPESQLVSRRLIDLLATSRRAQCVTGGRFDPRVILRLEALGERAGVAIPPVLDQLGVPRPWLACDPRRGLARLDAPVDSGGLGKGLALRWALRAVQRNGLLGTGLLLEAGGDLVVTGERSGGGSWQVGIEDPTGGGAPLAVMSVARGAVATSSIAVRRWTSPEGIDVHHLIDPATGQPGGEGLRAVTVAFPDPAWAEVWSKALFLAGGTDIGHQARRGGLAAWWVETDGSLRMTPAAREQTTWTAGGRAA